MKRALLACLSLTLLSLTFEATAQEQFSLDEYFRGTGVDLNAATGGAAQPVPQTSGSALAPVSTPAQGSFARPAATPLTRSLPPAQPQRPIVDRSQIDLLTGLPKHMTSQADGVLRTSGTIEPPGIVTTPNPALSPWPNLLTPPPAFIPPPAVRVAQGPIILEGRIEPLEMSLVPPLPSF